MHKKRASQNWMRAHTNILCPFEIRTIEFESIKLMNYLLKSNK